MKIAVKDACVLIDLANGGLLDLWFGMEIETITTDAVIHQIKDESQWQVIGPFVEADQLHVISLTGKDHDAMFKELGHLKVGYEDQSVLYVALKHQAILLTGDKKLRLEGLSRQLEVRGVLWVLTTLVSESNLAPAVAAAKLQQILDRGAYLPRAECDALLKKWQT